MPVSFAAHDERDYHRTPRITRATFIFSSLIQLIDGIHHNLDLPQIFAETMRTGLNFFRLHFLFPQIEQCTKGRRIDTETIAPQPRQLPACRRRAVLRQALSAWRNNTQNVDTESAIKRRSRSFSDRTPPAF